MTNEYFDPSATTLQTGSRARTAQVNDVASAISLGFDMLPDPENLTQSNTSYLADTGTADVYVVTFAAPLVPVAYVAGMEITMKVSNTSTGASTINVNALGAKSIKRQNGGAMLAEGLVLDGIYKMAYDITLGEFRLLNHTPTSRTTAGVEIVVA